MKKTISILFILLLTLIIKFDVYAASSSLLVSSSNVNVGEAFTVNASIYAAAWNIGLSAYGPVRCDGPMSFMDNSRPAINTVKVFKTSCTATGEGRAIFSLAGELRDENNSKYNPSNSVTVTITKQPTVVVIQPSTPKPSNNPPENNQEKPATIEEKSKNTKLKELSVGALNLVKVDDNNYTLEVPTNINEIDIKATPEDSKSKVTGSGKHKINADQTKIELIVTAESGDKNKITLLVTKKESDIPSIDELDNILKTKTGNQVTFKIKADSVLTTNQIKSIKTSEKTVNLDYYDNNKLIYSWIIDGKQIDDPDQFNTTVSLISKNEEKISKLANFAKGMNVVIKNENKFPKGTKLKLYIGYSYKNKDQLYIYYYNKSANKLELVKKDVEVENEYIEFYVEKGIDYFITKTKLDEEEKEDSSDSMLLPSVAFLGFSIIVFLGAIVIFKKQNSKKKIA